MAMTEPATPERASRAHGRHQGAVEDPADCADSGSNARRPNTAPVRFRQGRGTSPSGVESHSSLVHSPTRKRSCQFPPSARSSSAAISPVGAQHRSTILAH
ncbi:hypothetical protein HMPREF9567_02263 [Cutibacterium acnes HL013PA1]|nr:hypothetical protein HMPREF9567_02263 [Cutibacterium acnes HL013PA1]